MGQDFWTYFWVVGTFGTYIAIAVWARASSTDDFYVAGHDVHPTVNGMATADRLDVGSLLPVDGGPDRLPRLWRFGLPYGLDRRLCASGAFAGAVPARVRQVHCAGFRGGPVLFDHGPIDRRDVCPVRLVHLYCRPDEGRRRGLFRLPGGRVQYGHHGRHGDCVRLCGSGRHERHHLHPGGAILRADLCLYGSGDLHLPDHHGQSDPAAGVHLECARRGCGDARKAEHGGAGSGFPRIHPDQQVDDRCLCDHRRANVRHRRPAARDHPLLHRIKPGRGPCVGGVGAGLHRTALYDRTCGGFIRPSELHRYSERVDLYRG